MKITRVIFVALIISLFAFVCQFGCGKEKEARPKEQQTVQKPMDISRIPKEMLEALHGTSQEDQDEEMRISGVAKVPYKIAIPEEIEEKWKAIVIEVTDKKVGKTEEYTLALKSDFVIPGTRLKVHVQNFLPDFSMSPQEITTLSDEPKNPAAQVAISEDGKVIFEGWLFKLYPEVHAFQHPRYTIILRNHIRADQG